MKLLLHGFLKVLAGSELHHGAGGNVDFFAGAGVAALAGSALRHFEAAEAGQRNGVAGGEAFGEGLVGKPDLA